MSKNGEFYDVRSSPSSKPPEIPIGPFTLYYSRQSGNKITFRPVAVRSSAGLSELLEPGSIYTFKNKPIPRIDQITIHALRMMAGHALRVESENGKFAVIYTGEPNGSQLGQWYHPQIIVTRNLAEALKENDHSHLSVDLSRQIAAVRGIEGQAQYLEMLRGIRSNKWTSTGLKKLAFSGFSEYIVVKPHIVKDGLVSVILAP